MREKRVDELKDQVGKLGKRLDALIRTLGNFEDSEGRAFSLSAIIPGTDSSMSDLRAQHAASAGLIKKMDRKGAALVPVSYFNAALNSVRAVTNALDQIDTEIRNFDGWQGLNRVDYETFMAHAKDGSQRDLAPPFKTMFDSSEAFLEEFQELFQAINPSRASFNFSAAVDAFSAVIAKASEDRNKLANQLANSKSALDDINSRRETLETIAATASVEASNISEQLGKSSEASGQIEIQRTRVTEINNEAENLAEKVSDFGKKFAAFEESLEERLNKLIEGNNHLDELQSSLNDQKEQMRTIIEQSDSMLSAATVAGLSSEFKTIRDDLSSQLSSASNIFYVSIGLLFLSALPLIIFIFAPIMAPFISNDENLIAAIAATGTEKSGWQYVGQVAARFIILLPGIWLVTFSTGRYNSLFRLREHYSYKYSMAVAVDGFKKQAPGHEDLIAALVFEQLAFNPADKLGKQKEASDDAPNSVSKILIDFLRRKTDELQ